MAAIDVAGYVADLEDDSVDHGFHVHDERHFVETSPLRQVWRSTSTPKRAVAGLWTCIWRSTLTPGCSSPSRTRLLGWATKRIAGCLYFPLTFTWALPPLPNGPDLLRLAIDLAGIGGIELPLEVSAIDSFASATDGPERWLNIVGRHPVSLARVLAGEELLCDVFDRCLAVSRFLLESADHWLE